MEKRYFALGVVLAFVLLLCTLPAAKAATITFTFKDYDTYERITYTYIYWGTSSTNVSTYLGRTDYNGRITTSFTQTGTVYFQDSAEEYRAASKYIYSYTTSATVYLREKGITFTFYDSSHRKLTNKPIYWGTSSAKVDNHLGQTDSNGQIKTTFDRTGTIYFESPDGTYSGSAYVYSSTTAKSVYMDPETTTAPSTVGTLAVAAVALLIVLGILGAISYAVTREKRPPAPPAKPAPPPKKGVVQPPPGRLETKVYRHIKRHRGELDVKKCAKRLGVSEEEVEKAAKALVASGRLEQEE